MSDDDEEIIDVTASLMEQEAQTARWKHAHTVACQNITELNEQKRILMNVLHTALAVVEQVLTEMRAADVEPSPGLSVMKDEFTQAMRRLTSYADADRSDPAGEAPA